MCVVAVCVKLSYYLYRLHRPDVAPGTYVLSVIAHDHLFDKVRTQLSSSSRGWMRLIAANRAHAAETSAAALSARNALFVGKVDI